MFRTNLVVRHQEHGIIYCITQFGTVGTIVLSGESSCFEAARLARTAPDDERLDLFETCRADKKLWNKN